VIRTHETRSNALDDLGQRADTDLILWVEADAKVIRQLDDES